ncbi:MAG: 6-phosphofructokinase [Planctomycetia bacterium]|nr:MAG: 6-phosphofructokinase [Planctomycetia bacterium]
MSNRPRLGILVSGGPAPGINAVIGAATIEACNRGFEVVGFYDGFQWLSSDAFDPEQHALKLTIPRVSRIHFDGGSILRISRANLLDRESLKGGPVRPDAARVERVVKNLGRLGVANLLTIGGDDTALSARFLNDSGQVRVVHVPKTIDNDLPLPHDMPTFGFSTARYIGTDLVKNLMADAATTNRWYVVTAMGRSAGWLALYIGLAAGATVTLIPEEFGERTSVGHIVDIIEGAVLKRRVMNRQDGVVIMAEGLAYRLGDRVELERLLGTSVSVDAAGHPRLADVPLGDLIKRELTARFKQRGDAIGVITHELGYELRSADPSPFDMSYCRSLGYHSIRLFMRPERPKGCEMVTLVNGALSPVNLNDAADPATNRTRVRLVDVRSDYYRVARAYMIRLDRSDLENADQLAKLAAEARMTPEEFVKRFEASAPRLVDGVPAG